MWKTTKLIIVSNVTKISIMLKYSTYSGLCLELSTHLLVLMSAGRTKLNLYFTLILLMVKYDDSTSMPRGLNPYAATWSLLDFPMEHQLCIGKMIQVVFPCLKLNGIPPGSNKSTLIVSTRSIQQWYIYS